VDPVAVLTVVGSGTLVPDAHRGSPALHLREGGRGMLLDCGPGTVHGLARRGVDWRALEVVAVSHFHADHVGDLASLLQAFRYDGRSARLTLVGPPGLRSFMERMAALYGESVLEPDFPLVVTELVPGAAWSAEGWESELTCVPTPHTPESVAYRVQGPWGALGYTGDTGPDDRVVAHLEGCSVLVAECALSDPPELDTHLAPSDVARLAEAAHPDLLVLTHVYPPRTPDEAASAVRALYGGRVVAGYDGLRIGIDPSGVAPAPDVGLI
jgi:ribonuclease BN (tRNA processing enzyme)